MHYIILIAIIAVIVIIQWCTFANTKRKITIFLGIFPEKSDVYKLQKGALIEIIKSAKSNEIEDMVKSAGFDVDKYCYAETNEAGEEEWYFLTLQAKTDLVQFISNTEPGISVSHDNTILNTIVNSINDYLKNNKTVSDFHLMKDIVDRNCDAKEEEINTQIPIPLYMGLVGTMAGILIGILYLWLSGGIGDLLNAGAGAGADGVEALLGGVALAMVSSILGIILSTLGSIKFKTAKSVVENGKHTFLDWIQARLLPTLSDNVVGAIREMTGNLENFNKGFAENTGNLGSALDKVNESYKMQMKLLDAVQRIADKNLTHQNLQLYTALKNSTKEIGTLAEYLNNVNEYLTNVRTLNEKLDVHENRTRTIEEVGAFFRSELQQIEARKGAIAQSVGKVDDYLQQALEKLKEHTIASLQELQKSSVKQQDILREKTEEISEIVSELKNLSAIKESISRFELAMQMQNNKLDKLANNIVKTMKMEPERIIRSKSDFPEWLKITATVAIGIITLSCVTLTVKSFTGNTEKKNLASIQELESVFPAIKEDSISILMDSTMVNIINKK